MGTTVKVKYATPKKGRWYSNLRVPQALVPTFGCKIFQRALGTSDARAAEKLALVMKVKFDKACDLVRTGKSLKYALIASGMDEGTPFEVAQATIDNMPPQARQALLQGVQPVPGGDDIDALFAHLRSRARPLGDALPTIKTVLQTEDPIDRQVESLRLDLKVFKPYDAAIDKFRQAGLGTSAPKGKTLDDMLDLWKRETSPKIMQLNVFSMAVRRFKDVVGDLPLSDITSKHVATYKEHIAQLPSKTNHTDMHGKTIKEMIKIADEGGFKRVEGTMIARHLSAIRTLLEVAKENGILNQNVANEIKVRQKKKTGDDDDEGKKREFTAEELNKFMCAIAQEFDKTDDAYWFLPIGIFSGMRREEIGQLDIKDVCLEGEIYYFNVNTLDGKSTKNANSKRLIPMHQRLIDLGFLDHLERSSAKGPGKIFKSLKTNGTGRYTTAMYQRQKRVLRKVAGLTDPDLSPCHSTRHTFASACRDIDTSATTLEALLGHASSNPVTGKYGRRAVIETLNKALQQVEHIGVDLSNLTRKPT